ncbi:MAG: hypothetical protein HY979_00830 [Candidatus Magasanikbacteria bacterium]|nr:hypothetical protein [Candidatus Magasanikbacteria bacterium]
MFREFLSDSPGLELHQPPLSPDIRENPEKNERKQEIMEAIADIKRKLSSEFYADSNKRILPEFYNDKSAEGKQRLQDLKKNKFRKGWFTATLGDLQFAAKLLDGPTSEALNDRIKIFNKEVVVAAEVDNILIAKCEGLAKATIQLLQDKLDK